MKLSLEYLYLSHAPLGKILKLFLEACPDFCLLSKRREQQIIDDIALGDAPVSRDLFEAYSNNLRKAINTVFADGDTPLADSLRANVSRFSAYKAAIATEQIRSAARNGGDPEPVLHKFNRYQATEYSTAVNRARTGKQFDEFCQDRHLRLFPNLRWLPSTSADPREEHRVFWNRVWPKDDPFWSENQPGNLWNCHCDWEETDDDATADNPKSRVVEAHQGLEGNPAETGNVFSDEHTYMKHASASTGIEVIKAARDVVRAQHGEGKRIAETSLGKILIDKISIQECSKGSADDKSYFLKQEIAKNIEAYTKQMEFLREEEVDLSHNNKKLPFYRRKKHFKHIEVYSLQVKGYPFVIKIGEFKRNKLHHLYCITG
jgi:hypothetical protein